MRNFLVLMGICSALFSSVLQEAIDRAEPGSKIELPAGVFEGNILIDKPLVIVGKGSKTVIRGEGTGTVVKVRSSNVTLEGLVIENSGSQYETIDAAISIKDSRFCTVRNCIIRDTLFGIDLQNVSNSVIENNTISSKDLELGLRGDGIRLWYSNDNVLRNNRLIKSRDFVVWYSHGNLIEKNRGEYGRYSLHFMYAGKNIVRNNFYRHNSVGIFFMYSKDTVAENNVVMSSVGTTGIGIGLKDASNFTLKNNTVLYCAKGMYIDRSPYEPGTENIIESNKIMYNSIGIHFHSVSVANLITKNVFKGNIENVYDDSGREITHSVQNRWVMNYWDDYQGFDKNRDGIGDTPYTLYYYADKMWMLNPNVKFFYGSPVISILNFLAKLAPFSEPLKLLSDPKPLMYEKEAS